MKLEQQAGRLDPKLIVGSQMFDERELLEHLKFRYDCAEVPARLW